MTTKKITVIDGTTTIERDMTVDELAAYEAVMNEIKQDEINRKAKATARQAVLTKLKLTEAELSALLG